MGLSTVAICIPRAVPYLEESLKAICQEAKGATIVLCAAVCCNGGSCCSCLGDSIINGYCVQLLGGVNQTARQRQRGGGNTSWTRHNLKQRGQDEHTEARCHVSKTLLETSCLARRLLLQLLLLPLVLMFLTWRHVLQDLQRARCLEALHAE